MATIISSVRKVGYGHWDVIVEQDNYKRKFPYTLSSKTQWKYRTNDSLLIDEHMHDGTKGAYKRLVYMAKKYGTKKLIK